MKTLAALAACLVVTGCAGATGLRCDVGMSAGRTAELYFGRNIGDAPGVSDADWRDFLAQEVTPRFPDGLTVIDGSGQWRTAAGAIAGESSKIVVFVLSGSPEDRLRLDAVRSAYKRHFRQEAVLLVERPACVSFQEPAPSA